MSAECSGARDGADNGHKKVLASGPRPRHDIGPAEASDQSAAALQRPQDELQERARQVKRQESDKRHVMVSAEAQIIPARADQTPDLYHNHHHHHLSDNQSEVAKQTSHDEDERPLIELAQADGRRKWSQCSGATSQVSTSFGCSLSGSSSIGAGLNGAQSCRLASSRKSRSIVDCFQTGCSEPARADPDELQHQHHLSRSSNELLGSRSPNGSILNGHHNRQTGGHMMKRTISQSMLELDDSHLGPDATFQIYWRNLAFGYAPSNVIARLRAKVPWPKGSGRSPSPGDQLVLKHISGSFRSNQLVAIIGPSGCGKTTLLQFLAGTNKHQRERLRIRGLSEPKVAYIGQDDCLLPGLTARETLMYASRLQNGRVNFDHAHHIEPIIKELGLGECAERNVSKLSGGQAKRVTIGQQLLYPTNLLILDEVTSGLDASTSYSIVKLLKYLVSDQRYPMSIVMSIHQPSARLFAVFDHLYVMSAGSCLYEGSCNLGEINERLARFGLACPPYHNMADYLIELACAGSSGSAAAADGSEDGARPAPGATDLLARQSKTPADDQASDWRLLISDTGPVRVRAQMIEHQRKLQEDLQLAFEPPTGQHQRQRQQLPAGPDHSLHSAVELARRHRPRPLMHHFRTHLWRSLLRIRRSYILTYLQLATYILLGLQLATFYGPDIGQLGGCPRLPGSLMSYVLSSGANEQQQDQESDNLALEVRRIQENMNFLLVAVMLATFAALEITVITFPMEAKTIKREWANGWYSVSSYFAGRTLADLPFQLVFVVLFCLLIYQMTGQLGLASWRFGSFVGVVMMTALAAQSFGFMFGAIFMNNLPAAVFTAPLAIFPSLLFSGFFSRVSQIPTFYKPMTYISHFRYAFDSLLVTLYGFDRCHCDQTTLDQYHLGMRNQTSSMREMFSYLFGATDCGALTSPPLEAAEESQPSRGSAATSSTPSPAGIISHEDLNAIQASNSTLAAQLFKTIVENAPDAATAATVAAPTSAPLRPPPGFMGPIEDALVDSLLERMNSSTGDAAAAAAPGGELANESLFDRLANQSAQRLTKLLNKQANFGKEMPRNCSQFNSYLMAEFELADEDLLFGLLMLFVMVLLTRLLCNYLLNYTIANRNN